LRGLAAQRLRQWDKDEDEDEDEDVDADHDEMRLPSEMFANQSSLERWQTITKYAMST